MSGTSLDGLDIAICRFDEFEGNWSFEILGATTIEYSSGWKKILSGIHGSDALTFARTHSEYGSFIGKAVHRFCNESGIEPDLIASHGHTVFHQPGQHFTFQLGCGAAIAALTGIDTVCDFRSTDVALSGQGAPLVPFGDKHLFGGHRFCLNLGGIANISYEHAQHRIAFDICPANMALNYLAQQAGLSYDENGLLSGKGKINRPLLKALNDLAYYKLPSPKSMGREWFESEFKPLLDTAGIPLNDKLRTVTEHAGVQISEVLFHAPGTTMLTTGGGAFNPILVECIEDHLSRHGIHVVIPASDLVNFKEALIFAFLGLNRKLEYHNTLASVTGASRDSTGGAYYKG